MGAKKKIKRSVIVGKPFLVVTAIVLGAIILFLGWQYIVNRPNYRDLKQEYSKLSIPSDWKLVSESSSKGTWGLFCWQIGNDSPCPVFGKTYQSNKKISPNDDLSYINLLLIQNNFKNTFSNVNDCNLQSANYYCSVAGIKIGMVLMANIGVDKSGQKILDITLEQKNGAVYY